MPGRRVRITRLVISILALNARRPFGLWIPPYAIRPCTVSGIHRRFIHAIIRPYGFLVLARQSKLAPIGQEIGMPAVGTVSGPRRNMYLHAWDA